MPVIKFDKLKEVFSKECPAIDTGTGEFIPDVTSQRIHNFDNTCQSIQFVRYLPANVQRPMVGLPTSALDGELEAKKVVVAAPGIKGGAFFQVISAVVDGHEVTDDRVARLKAIGFVADKVKHPKGVSKSALSKLFVELYNAIPAFDIDKIEATDLKPFAKAANLQRTELELLFTELGLGNLKEHQAGSHDAAAQRRGGSRKK